MTQKAFVDECQSSQRLPYDLYLAIEKGDVTITLQNKYFFGGCILNQPVCPSVNLSICVSVCVQKKKSNFVVQAPTVLLQLYLNFAHALIIY